MNTQITIEEQICSAIRSVTSQFPNGANNSAWTKAIFKAIGDLGAHLGSDVCASSSDGEFDSGWLYDLVWYRSNSEGLLESVTLVLESEWHMDYRQIRYDFEKLLVAKAQHKVMVFQASGDLMMQYFDRMKSGIEAFLGESDDSTYILACFDEPNWRFEIQIYGRAEQDETQQPPLDALSSTSPVI